MRYKLELEDDEFDFEGWAFLHFHTTMPGYAFADCLNRLYDYRLARVDDMTLDGVAWPLYRFEEPLHHSIFFLVERPVQAVEAAWEAGDKVLVVKGETAESLAHDIYSDFTVATDVPEGDLLAREHADLLDELLADFTVVNLLDFSTPPATRKAAKERLVVQQHCDAILTHIEQQHLDLSEVVRMRMEMEKEG